MSKAEVLRLLRVNGSRIRAFDSFRGLAFFLEDLLGRRVELVTPESLSPYIGPHILEEAEDAELPA